MYSVGTSLWNRSLIELTKIIRGCRHRSGSASRSGRSAGRSPARRDGRARRGSARRTLGVAVVAPGADLRAPGHGVPGRVGPLDGGRISHVSRQNIMRTGILVCSSQLLHRSSSGHARGAISSRFIQSSLGTGTDFNDCFDVCWRQDAMGGSFRVSASGPKMWPSAAPERIVSQPAGTSRRPSAAAGSCWPEPPGATGSEHVEDRVHDLPHRPRSRASRQARRRQVRLQQSPLLVAHIACVTQVLAAIAPRVAGST